MKKSILIIIVIIIAGIVFWMFKSKTNAPATEINAPTAQSQVGDAEISAINKDIESIDIGSTDQEFNDVNKDLQGL